jgi:hypothetical protein
MLKFKTLPYAMPKLATIVVMSKMAWWKVLKIAFVVVMKAHGPMSILWL